MQALTSTTRATLRAPRRATTRMEAETSAAPKAPAAKKQRKPAPLEVGGTKSGAQAAGKAASAKAVAAATGSTYVEPASATTFNDPRWVEGCWDFAQFKGADGETDWNSVVDAEVRRRKILEDYPVAGDVDFPVTFDLSMIPAKVWITRFHLPEAELINGRASMIGFFAAWMVDAVFHVGIADQMGSPLGKILLVATLLGCLFVRRNEDYDGLKGLADEATFYDRQWNATWDGIDRDSIKDE